MLFCSSFCSSLSLEYPGGGPIVAASSISPGGDRTAVSSAYPDGGSTTSSSLSSYPGGAPIPPFS